MNNFFENLLQRLTSFISFEEEDIETMRIISTAGIALLVIILQAFISIGVHDSSASISVLLLAIALPFLAIFAMRIPKYTNSTPLGKILLFAIYYIGAFVGTVALIQAFYHLSESAGNAISISIVVCVILFIFLVSQS